MEKNSPIFRALEEGLWAPLAIPSYRYDARYQDDAHAFMLEMSRAWREKSWIRHVMMAEAHFRCGALDRKLLVRLCSALATTGRFQQALELLLAERSALEGDPRFWRDLATIYAGLGRLQPAARALETCLAADPGHDGAEDLKARLAPALELEQRLGPDSPWSDWRDLIDHLVGFGALDRAAETARAFLRARREVAPEEAGDLLGAAQLALAVLGPEHACAIVGDLQHAFPDGPERRLLASTLGQLTGEESGKSALKSDKACKHDRQLRLTAALACLVGGRRTAAIERAGRLGELFKSDRETRLVLAHAVGQEVLAAHPVAYRSGGGRKVFNLVTFNNERDLLKAKLAEESAFVDQFVIVEANRTFTGIEKPLFFEAWKSEFAQWADKIVHVKVESFPEWATTAWARDFYQRDMAVAGASGLWGVDDLVLITDADEIVDRRAVEGFEGEHAAMLMETFRFFLNYHSTQGTQHTGVMFRAKYLQRFSPSFCRFMLRSSRYVELLDNCGWHFTSVSDAKGVAAKMKSYAHQEYAAKDEAYFERIFEKIRSGRKQALWEYWEIDERFPTSIRENKDALERLILPTDAVEAA
jgi:beta-1,4-mannosyl-glycoprotein beta-1,4-N-acetylglucosaminyltransferase